MAEEPSQAVAVCATCGHHPLDPEHTESSHAYTPATADDDVERAARVLKEHSLVPWNYYGEWTCSCSRIDGPPGAVVFADREQADRHQAQQIVAALAEHGPDWSDWSDDHPEEGPSCRCGFNGSPEECAASRRAGQEVDRFRCPACGHWCVWVDDAWVCSKRGGCGAEYTPDQAAYDFLAERLNEARDERDRAEALLAARGDAATPTATVAQVRVVAACYARDRWDVTTTEDDIDGCVPRIREWFSRAGIKVEGGRRAVMAKKFEAPGVVGGLIAALETPVPDDNRCPRHGGVFLLGSRGICSESRESRLCPRPVSAWREVEGGENGDTPSRPTEQANITLGNLVSVDDMILEASRQVHAISDAGKAGQAVNRAARLRLGDAQDWPIVIAVQVAAEMLLAGHAQPVEDHVNAS